MAASSSSNYNGSTLILADCQYDYDTVASSGQYFQYVLFPLHDPGRRPELRPLNRMSTSDGSTVGLLLNEQGELTLRPWLYCRLCRARAESSDVGSPSYGPNPHLDDGAPLSLYDGPANGPFTYFGFKAQQF